MTSTPLQPTAKTCSACKHEKPLHLFNKAAYFSKAHDDRRFGLEKRLAMIKHHLPERCATCPTEISIDYVGRLPKTVRSLHPDATPKWMAGQGWAEERILDEMDLSIFVCPTCYRRATEGRTTVRTRSRAAAGSSPETASAINAEGS